MKVTAIDKFILLSKVYERIFKLPVRFISNVLLKPLEDIRYTEFGYFLKYIRQQNLKNMTVLDVSSPYIMSYILSNNNKVIKTDINPGESKFIKPSPNLTFQTEDALKFSFPDNTFDLVYSVSVIEHIYQAYQDAVKEMLRVTKPGGLVYLSFPVSSSFSEEWLSADIYSHQQKKEGKIFFQYRFDKNRVEKLLSDLKDATVVEKDIFWERKNGAYNKMLNHLRVKTGSKILDFLKNSVLCFYNGFMLLESVPENSAYKSSFGNISIVLKKELPRS